MSFADLIAALIALLSAAGPTTGDYQVAVRGEQVVLVEVGLHGQPFAPENLEKCAEMGFYRAQAGLPERFNTLGRRESDCRNEDNVKTWCCHGYWQMWTSLHLDDPRMAPKMVECGVLSHHDLNSDNPLEKQKQACAAKALYDVAGYQPWT